MWQWGFTGTGPQEAGEGRAVGDGGGQASAWAPVGQRGHSRASRTHARQRRCGESGPAVGGGGVALVQDSSVGG